MQHSIILRAAWALTISLVVVAAAFAWSANQRERQAAAHAAANPAAATETAPGAVVDPAARRAAVTETWDKRCAKCHEATEMPEWLATQPGDKVAALETFLGQHGKSSADESRLLAGWFGTGETL